MGKRDASVFGSDRKWEIIAKGYNLGRGSLGNWSSLSTMVMGTETVLEAAWLWAKSSVREDLKSQMDYSAG